MKKGQILEGKIDFVEFPNKGTVNTQEGRVTVKNTIPGQTVRFMIQKKRKNKAEGRLLEVIESSPLEKREPLCKNFPDCGGCMYQTMEYEDQLAMKERQLHALLDQAIKDAGQTEDYLFEGIKPSPVEKAYRNKMEFSFGDAHKDGPLTLGLHKKGSTYDVLTTDDCAIVNEDFNTILRCVLDYFTEHPMPFYKKMQHEGYLRHLLLRRSHTSGELLINLVTTSQQTCDLNPLKERLLILEQGELAGRIAGILHIVNDSLADVVQSDETTILYGRDYFYETILGLRFKITPFSFFQTNSPGAEVLYAAAREYIGETKDKVIFDLYSGTGTIAQVLAGVAKKVIGVEIVEEAVGAARINAEINGLDNCTFIAGDVLKMLDTIEERPDCIVLDPPRDGIHPRALKQIIDYGVDRIVYISCKPTSLARDLQALLAAGYRVDRLCLVDLFVNTVHCESIALLQKRD